MNSKYTLQRFLAPLDPVLVDIFRAVLFGGRKFTAEWLPVDLLGQVLLIATYARDHEKTEIVEDYDLLLDRVRSELYRLQCVDKFFVSSIIIMHYRDQVPELASYRLINMPEIYQELRGDC